MAESPGLVLVDDGKGRFGPLCDLRPVFALRTGVWTTGERLAEHLGRAVACVVPAALAGLVGESHGGPVNRLPAGDAFRLVSGRLLQPRLAADLALGSALLASDGSLVAAHLGRADAESFVAGQGLASGVRVTASETHLLDSPWRLLDQLGACIADDVRSLLAGAGALVHRVLDGNRPDVMGSHPVLLHESASIAPHVVFDASAGPIVVGAKAVIRPFSVLCGPCSIGPGSTVTDRSLIKANTTCGPQCRLGGEIGGTSIVGYSNKAHDGHLGDSIVGEWVNLGAGTDNSNLLNTYSEVPVRLEPDGPRERTGRIFFGSVIGDHVKCAIGTRLMTGTVLGTGAMVARSTPPPSTVRRFAWLTDDGERSYQIGKFVEVARTVMARRSLVPGPAYLERLGSLHAAATAER